MSKICSICGKPLKNGVIVHQKCIPQSWIPVSERMPDHGVDFLTYHSGGHTPIRMNILRSTGDGFLFDARNCHSKREKAAFGIVTHWMPLPDKPKGM